MDYIIIKCPHCNDEILIYLNEINCLIFRHGILKDTLKQIDAHASKEICDNLFENKLIYGCGKPFRLNKVNVEGISHVQIPSDKKYEAIICEYI